MLVEKKNEFLKKAQDFEIENLNLNQLNDKINAEINEYDNNYQELKEEYEKE